MILVQLMASSSPMTSQGHDVSTVIITVIASQITCNSPFFQQRVQAYNKENTEWPVMKKGFSGHDVIMTLGL